MRFQWIAMIVAVAACGLVGCDVPIAHFGIDSLYVDKIEGLESVELSAQQQEDVATILTALFGTPDEPYIPDGEEISEVVDPKMLAMAAGVIGSDELGRARGLYREHCVHCHGINGDGKGPTAPFLNPYPRDYRRGVFKFKSTPRGSRPTHDDLKRTLVNGVPGTSMPSFKLLPDSQIESLVNYVKYLSIRGEVERLLIEETAIELDDGERLIDESNLAESGEWARDEILSSVAEKWGGADSEVTAVPARPSYDNEQLLASIHRGKQLFYGAVANCVKCHGDSQLGDGQVDDYDDWVKDYADKWISQTDETTKQQMLDQLLAAGALRPRNIIPRDLRAGVYRGGRRPVDLYWRMHDGIDGTPMPAAMMLQPGATSGLTPDDLWDLVNYVQSLPYESMSTTGPDGPVYQRSRM